MRHPMTVLPQLEWLQAAQAGRRMFPAECLPPRMSGITCSFCRRGRPCADGVITSRRHGIFTCAGKLGDS